MNLTKEIVLKPEDDFFVIRESRERIILFPQLLRAFFEVSAVSGRQMLRAHAAKFVRRQIARRRTANQSFPPDEMITRNASFPRRSGRRVSVVDVQHYVSSFYHPKASEPGAVSDRCLSQAGPRTRSLTLAVL